MLLKVINTLIFKYKNENKEKNKKHCFEYNIIIILYKEKINNKYKL